MTMGIKKLFLLIALLFWGPSVKAGIVEIKERFYRNKLEDVKTFLEAIDSLHYDDPEGFGVEVFFYPIWLEMSKYTGKWRIEVKVCDYGSTRGGRESVIGDKRFKEEDRVMRGLAWAVLELYSRYLDKRIMVSRDPPRWTSWEEILDKKLNYPLLKSGFFIAYRDPRTGEVHRKWISRKIVKKAWNAFVRADLGNDWASWVCPIVPVIKRHLKDLTSLQDLLIEYKEGHLGS